MRDRGEGAIVRDLGRLLRDGVEVDDGELLRRFQTRGDGEAFEAIVIRHGPMVRGVCGRLLRDPHDADDAFQATFLVLARDGGKVRDPGRLASWLYTTARRVSLRARSRASRRRAEPLIDDVVAPEARGGEWADVLPILDAELARLPAAQRDVLTLCLLGGATEQEAARRLDCPVGTVKSRLSRGRDSLRVRLIRRGVTPAVAMAAASASSGSFASVVPHILTRATVAAASAGGAIPPAVAALARGVPSMSAKSTILASALAGGLGLLGWSAGGWTSNPPPAQAPKPPEVAPVPVAAAEVKANNLRQILLAMHKHIDASGDLRLPAQAIRGGPEGTALLSWRVALLPFLGEEALYKEFHLDESWDSPHNRVLIPRMPAVYQAPDIPAPAGQSRFLGFWGPGAMFEPLRPAERSRTTAGPDGMEPPDLEEPRRRPDQGVTLTEVTDGTGNTVLLGVAWPVEWTRPLDISLNPRQPIPALDASDPRGFLVGMVDGAAQYLPDRPTRPQFLAALVTRAGGEMLDWEGQTARPDPQLDPQITSRGTAGRGPTAPSAGSPPAGPSVEERIDRLEETLDRLLKKLAPEGEPTP